MKKSIIKYIAIQIIVISLFFVQPLLAQGPPEPPGGAGGTSNTGANQNGGSAPIGGGLFVLLGLSAAYGARKIYKHLSKDLEELEQ